ncbi:MAG: beta-propeller domain-containing protein [Propionibacteriales bacterium]|nr:beta-propeller domain-containing protein [Propionibacteriales bacterium]
MRPLSKVALGGGFVSLATVGGLVAAGLLATTATLVVTDPLAPRANADSLSRFDSCASLLHWYVDHSVDEVGPYGWGGPAIYAMDMPMGPMDSAPGFAPEASAGSVDSAKSADARASSSTGTNTQEADVDEPDLAKTDGRRVVRLVDERTLVITDVTGAEPRELGRMPLPIDVYGGELLLAGDHVLISQAGGGNGMGGVSMRLYGDTVRVVTSTDRPQLAFVMPHEQGKQSLSDAAATRRNRELVRATTIEDWLPAVVDNRSPGAHSRLLDCTDVYHPDEWSGGQTTAVTTYDVADPDHRQSVGVTADGQVVYSSADRLYVGSTRMDFQRSLPGSDAMQGRMVMPVRPQNTTTQLHAFALKGTDTTYVGSGHVTGTVRDRWSMDEHDGKLRVAWTRDRSGTITDSNGETRQHSQNGITVLTERDGALVPTGTIDQLGIDENIQSVRWFDDFAVLVTFRQMDPLYTVDLTDQDHPREIGSLKIPGYSGYLHPIGDGKLLGLGVDATDEGHNLGAQAAVFDIGDLADPQRVSRQGFGASSSLPAIDDPRAFTWLPDQRTGLTTVSTWTNDKSRLVALHVDEAGALTATDLVTDLGWNVRTLPLEDGRVALVDDQSLRVIDVG